MKTSILLPFLFLLSTVAFAQDKIFKKDQSVISCKIVEIGTEEIKYKELDMPDGPIIAILIDKISKVELQNGRVIEFKDPLIDPENYVDNKKSAIKLHFLSPLAEQLAFSYERSLRPGRSIESSLGIIGLGFNTEENIKSTGVALGFGYKFMRTPDFYARRMSYAHILKGAYIKPELLVSIYHMEEDRYMYYSGSSPTPVYGKQEDDIVSVAVLMNFGKQVVFDNSFLIDWSLGIGYGYSSQNSTYEDYNYSWHVNNYGFIMGNDNFPIALSAKIKIGFLLK